MNKAVLSQDLKPGDRVVVHEVRTVKRVVKIETPDNQCVIVVECEGRQGEVHYPPYTRVELD